MTYVNNNVLILSIKSAIFLRIGRLQSGEFILSDTPKYGPSVCRI